MTLIVKTITRITFGLILIYGIYIATETHNGPGSGFAAGIIIALSLIQLMLAFGKEKIIGKIDEVKGITVISISGIVFLSILAFGCIYQRPASKIALFLADISLAVMVGMSLFVVFLALVLLTGRREER